MLDFLGLTVDACAVDGLLTSMNSLCSVIN